MEEEEKWKSEYKNASKKELCECGFNLWIVGNRINIISDIVSNINEELPELLKYVVEDNLEKVTNGMNEIGEKCRIKNELENINYRMYLDKALDNIRKNTPSLNKEAANILNHIYSELGKRLFECSNTKST